jgi:hypothetical protein
MAQFTTRWHNLQPDDEDYEVVITIIIIAIPSSSKGCRTYHKLAHLLQLWLKVASAYKADTALVRLL